MAREEHRLDIHNYDRKTKQAEAEVLRAPISDRNKELILQFRNTCMLRNICGKVRLIRVVGALKVFAKIINKNFDELNRADLEALLIHLHDRRPVYAAETLGSYKGIIKRFMTWVVQPNEFPTKTPPALVAWINAHTKKKDRRRLSRNELLTPSDMAALLRTCQNTRDRAMLCMLWETGGRIAEIGNLQLKHICKREFGYTLDLIGKTGQRNPLIVSSAPLLAQWLAHHPFPDDPENPLWVHHQFQQTPRLLRYDSILYFLKRHFLRAGVTKRVYPHLFRHSRPTYCLAAGIMNEAQAKAYFGWTPDSDMLARYSHLIDQDANNAVLRENHLAAATPQNDELRPRACTLCNTLNMPETQYCTHCTGKLDTTTAYQADEQQKNTHELALRLARILVEQGYVDEAVKQIHDAGLGNVLKTLATAHNIQQPAPPPNETPPT